MLLYRSEASGCSDGKTAGENPGVLGERHPLPASAPETVLERQCIQQGHSPEVPTVGSTTLRLCLGIQRELGGCCWGSWDEGSG